MARFRDLYPKEHTPSWIKITTITMVSKFLNEIDIQKLRDRLTALGSIFIKKKGSKFDGFEWKLKPTTFYNQVTLTYTDSYSTKSIKVFPNGSIQVAGCADLFDCNLVIQQLIYILKTVLNIETPLPSNSFRVVMINTNFSLNYNINLMALFAHFSRESIFKVTFDPDRYSAVKIKFKPASDMKQVTVSIFSTGKIIVTGAETLKEIVYAYNIINRHIISGAGEIKVKQCEEKDVFDIFMGFKIYDLARELTIIGFRPWTENRANDKINF
jgi:TATA-box binding protein (TBP) (component of TFIID and TFIIIB)